MPSHDTRRLLQAAAANMRRADQPTAHVPADVPFRKRKIDGQLHFEWRMSLSKTGAHPRPRKGMLFGIMLSWQRLNRPLTVHRDPFGVFAHGLDAELAVDGAHHRGGLAI